MPVCLCRSDSRLAGAPAPKESNKVPALAEELSQVADSQIGADPRASGELQTRAAADQVSTVSPTCSEAGGGVRLANHLSLPPAADLLESALFEGRQPGYRFWARWACR